MINRLVKNNKPLGEEFFDIDGELSPGESWYADLLHEQGLPQAYALYSEGFTTPSKCLKIDPDDFLKRKGVGPKKVEQLIAFQAKAKRAIQKKQQEKNV